MKYSHASHKDRSNTWQWSHKIVMDYKQEVCLQCWKKRLAPAMMDVEFTAALNGLNGGGGCSARWPLTLCPPAAVPRSWGGSERSLPTPSTLTHSCTQTRFTPFLFFSVFPPRPDQKKQVSLSLFFPPSLPSSSPFYYFPSQALYLGRFQSLLFLSPSLPWHLLLSSTLPPMAPPSTALPCPTNEHTWAHTFYF